MEGRTGLENEAVLVEWSVDGTCPSGFLVHDQHCMYTTSTQTLPWQRSSNCTPVMPVLFPMSIMLS